MQNGSNGSNGCNDPMQRFQPACNDSMQSEP